LDPSSGVPFEWTSILAEWSHVLLFTWKDPRDWFRAEWVLETQIGVKVIPATEAGLILAAGIFAEFDYGEDASLPHPSRSFLPDRKRLYGYFAGRERILIDEIEPPEQEIQQMFARLRSVRTPLSGLQPLLYILHCISASHFIWERTSSLL
jgi:hypothetical protein